ncbi:hypothetical protein GOP47_0020636 [Adiantum capillus-veneris]|uniref:Uncharacterized protein n=1 Tax=Adiantum capillus-veneris TaxID=13818 RepID=A0A9D4U9I0_ADICA|nr:hypothetical protein GOP47_0020636 [Adiantum capillus-veneris]
MLQVANHAFEEERDSAALLKENLGPVKTTPRWSGLDSKRGVWFLGLVLNVLVCCSMTSGILQEESLMGQDAWRLLCWMLQG